ADRDAVMAADGLLVPGVGAFAAVMGALDAVRGPELIERRLAGDRKVLGICVGMQVMFERGVERGVETEGLGEWPGVVEELHAPVLPHMGWNTVSAPDDSALFAGIREERFYFVHSYAARSWDLDPIGAFRHPRVTWSEHGEPFVAAVENGPLSATQFHPEKSGEAGIRLLGNWLETL
ncbi:imidazole glycerol phosphate synthase subunit HisH, partial [Schumannella luteola]